MQDEMRAHLDEQTARNVAAGMNEEDARAAAHRQFGGVAQIQERAREVHGFVWLDMLQRDFRFAVRSLSRRPGFTLTTLVILALGIGMSTSTFSVTNAAQLRPLPFPESARLVGIRSSAPDASDHQPSPGEFVAVQAARSPFLSVAAFTYETANIAAPDAVPTPALGLAVTTDFLNTLGLHPLFGRDFRSDDGEPGTPAVALLTCAMWQRHFGGDRTILGKALRLDGQDTTVIGVLPPSFDRALLWAGAGYVRPRALPSNAATDWSAAGLEVIARLRTDVGPARARAELAALSSRLVAAGDRPHTMLRIVDLQGSNLGRNGRALNWLITGLAALVLLIACANLAGIQLARSIAGGRELATRAALGASRLRLMLPGFLECVILTAAGGILAGFVTVWFNSIVERFYTDASFTFSVPIDRRVLAYAATIGLLTIVAFAVVPTWITSRQCTNDALKQGAASTTPNRTRRRLGRMLVTGQVAVAVVLTSAALSFSLGGSLAVHRDLGWTADELVGTTILLPRQQPKQERRVLIGRMRETLRRIPGVTDVVLGTIPLHDYRGRPVVPVGAAPDRLASTPEASVYLADHDYFSVLKIPFRSGRSFRPNLNPDGPAVAIVSETLARHLWPGQAAVGRYLRFADEDTPFEVVGVVADVEPVDPESPRRRPQLYLAIEHSLPRAIFYGMRSNLSPSALDGAVRKGIAAIDPDIVVVPPGSIRGAMESAVGVNRLIDGFLGAFAGYGLVLSLLGLYGVVSQLTTYRTHEIGIRMALGANQRDVVRLVLSQGCRMILVGLILGLGGALAVDRVYRSIQPQLILPEFDVKLGVVVLVSFASLVASWYPARRAAKVNPVVALRAE